MTEKKGKIIISSNQAAVKPQQKTGQGDKVAAATNQQAKKQDSKEKPEIRVYTTPTCQYCAMAKAYFKEKGLEFDEYDVMADKAKAQEMVKVSGQTGVPVIMINGRVIVGFNRQLVDDALKRPRLPKRDEFLNNLIFDPFAP